ncbi:hypothetical protein EGT50_09930 [Rhodococcus xishaensis]|uniref:HNH endonuclease n=1 Tax=Rhodococcus xishaensis TaxID=2487364 RepID=A0A3S3CQ60_9NOCA|nr:hypothetical protein EGT50_09930 [Rhodococcus xishaensis]
MPRSGKRVCRIPGCPAIQGDSLCGDHRREHDRHQHATTPTKTTRDWQERQRRARAVRDHVAQHGNWCPGVGRPPHAAADLTANHVVPIARGGDPRGPLTVVCRPCNSRQADRF